MRDVGKQLVDDVMKGFWEGSIRMPDGSDRACMTRNGMQLFLTLFLSKYEEMKKNGGNGSGEREKLNADYLLSHGYILDEKESELLAMAWENSPDYVEGINLESYVSRDGRIEVRRERTNRYGNEGYGVHVDNKAFDSVGWGEFLYVDDFEKFIESVYDRKESQG